MKKSKPSIWFLCVCHREVSEWGRPEEHGQPEQDYSGHVAAKSWALLLWWGGKLRLPVWVLRQRQRLLGHEVTFLCDFCVFATFFFKCSLRSIFVVFVHSQPIMVCRQCPGYQADVSQLLFPTASSYWLSGLPASALVPTPPKPAATEGCAKAAGEQPSTSSDVPSGDGEYHHLKFSLGHTEGILRMAAAPRSYSWVVPSILTFGIRIFAAASCAAPQEYRCPPRGFHLVCSCCLQPMPDRRAELGSQQVPQQCEWRPNPLTQAYFQKWKSFCRRIFQLFGF